MFFTIKMFIFKLFSNLYITFIISNLTTLNIGCISNVFEIEFPLWVGYIHSSIIHYNIVYILLTFLECIIVKYWMKFVCKTVLPIDSQFVVTCFTIINNFISIILTVLRIQSGGGHVIASEVVSYRDWCSTWCQPYPYKLK